MTAAQWSARHTDEFEEWFTSLTPPQQGAVIAAVEILEERGPMLGRPLVDRIKGSAFHHMKELRVSESGDLRILFAFDAERRPILLLGGDKHGQWDRLVSRSDPDRRPTVRRPPNEVAQENGEVR